MNRKNNIVLGGIFVVLGIFFLLKSFNKFDITLKFTDIGFLFAFFWPAMFLILPGFLIHLSFFNGSRKDAGVLVPGGILLITGLTCQVSMLFGIWGVTWPGYIFAVAFGLFELYLFGNREKGLLIPVGILTAISLIFFQSITFNAIFGFKVKNIIIAAVLIALGGITIIKGLANKGTPSSAGENPQQTPPQQEPKE